MKRPQSTRARPNETQDEFNKRKQLDHYQNTSATGGEQAYQREVTTRLRRIETRLVAGLEELGASNMKRGAGVQVQLALEGEVGTITITSLGTTVKEMLDAIGNNRGTYAVMYNGKQKCLMNTENIL